MDSPFERNLIRAMFCTRTRLIEMLGREELLALLHAQQVQIEVLVVIYYSVSSVCGKSFSCLYN